MAREADWRPLIVFDGEFWFIRRVRVSIHDGEADEMVYRCDKPIGGPYDSIDEAVEGLDRHWK